MEIVFVWLFRYRFAPSAADVNANEYVCVCGERETPTPTRPAAPDGVLCFPDVSAERWMVGWLAADTPQSLLPRLVVVFLRAK